MLQHFFYNRKTGILRTILVMVIVLLILPAACTAKLGDSYRPQVGIMDGVYYNDIYGIEYTLPEGWVVFDPQVVTEALWGGTEKPPEMESLEALLEIGRVDAAGDLQEAFLIHTYEEANDRKFRHGGDFLNAWRLALLLNGKRVNFVGSYLHKIDGVEVYQLDGYHDSLLFDLRQSTLAAVMDDTVLVFRYSSRSSTSLAYVDDITANLRFTRPEMYNRSATWLFLPLIGLLILGVILLSRMLLRQKPQKAEAMARKDLLTALREQSPESLENDKRG